MKKFFKIILTLLLVLGSVGCSNSNEEVKEDMQESVVEPNFKEEENAVIVDDFNGSSIIKLNSTLSIEDMRKFIQITYDDKIIEYNLNQGEIDYELSIDEENLVPGAYYSLKIDRDYVLFVDEDYFDYSELIIECEKEYTADIQYNEGTVLIDATNEIPVITKNSDGSVSFESNTPLKESEVAILYDDEANQYMAYKIITNAGNVYTAKQVKLEDAIQFIDMYGDFEAKIVDFDVNEESTKQLSDKIAKSINEVLESMGILTTVSAMELPVELDLNNGIIKFNYSFDLDGDYYGGISVTFKLDGKFDVNWKGIIPETFKVIFNGSIDPKVELVFSKTNFDANVLFGGATFENVVGALQTVIKSDLSEKFEFGHATIVAPLFPFIQFRISLASGLIAELQGELGYNIDTLVDFEMGAVKETKKAKVKPIHDIKFNIEEIGSHFAGKLDVEFILAELTAWLAVLEKSILNVYLGVSTGAYLEAEGAAKMKFIFENNKITDLVTGFEASGELGAFVSGQIGVQALNTFDKNYKFLDKKYPLLSFYPEEKVLVPLKDEYVITVENNNLASMPSDIQYYIEGDASKIYTIDYERFELEELISPNWFIRQYGGRLMFVKKTDTNWEGKTFNAYYDTDHGTLTVPIRIAVEKKDKEENKIENVSSETNDENKNDFGKDNNIAGDLNNGGKITNVNHNIPEKYILYRMKLPKSYEVLDNVNNILIYNNEKFDNLEYKHDWEFGSIQSSNIYTNYVYPYTANDDRTDIDTMIYNVEYIVDSSDVMACYNEEHGTSKWGCYNIYGENIVPHIYSLSTYVNITEMFEDRLIRVYKDDKVGFIDSKGEEVIPIIYDDGFHIGSGFIQTILNDEYYLYNTKGNLLRKNNAFFDYVSNVGLYSIKENGYYGVYDSANNLVVPHVYKSIGAFSNGFAPVSDDNKEGFIDVDGNVVVPLVYDYVGYVNKNGMAIVGKDDKYGVIDIQGNIVIPFEYAYPHYITLFETNPHIFLVKNNEGAFIINREGKKIVKVKRINEYSDLKNIHVSNDEKLYIFATDSDEIVGEFDMNVEYSFALSNGQDKCLMHQYNNGSGGEAYIFNDCQLNESVLNPFDNDYYLSISEYYQLYVRWWRGVLVKVDKTNRNFIYTDYYINSYGELYQNDGESYEKKYVFPLTLGNAPNGYTYALDFTELDGMGGSIGCFIENGELVYYDADYLFDEYYNGHQ